MYTYIGAWCGSFKICVMGFTGTASKDLDQISFLIYKYFKIIVKNISISTRYILIKKYRRHPLPCKNVLVPSAHENHIFLNLVHLLVVCPSHSIINNAVSSKQLKFCMMKKN